MWYLLVVLVALVVETVVNILSTLLRVPQIVTAHGLFPVGAHLETFDDVSLPAGVVVLLEALMQSIPPHHFFKKCS